MPNQTVYVFATGKITLPDFIFGDINIGFNGFLEEINSNASSSTIFALFPDETFNGGFKLKGYLLEENNPIDIKKIWDKECKAYDEFRKHGRKRQGSPALIFTVDIEVKENELLTQEDGFKTIAFERSQIFNITEAHTLQNGSFFKHDLSVPEKFSSKYRAIYEQVEAKPQEGENEDKKILRGCIALCDYYLRGRKAHTKEVKELKTAIDVEYLSGKSDMNIVLENIKEFQKIIIKDILAKKDKMFSRGKKENGAALAEVMFSKLVVQIVSKEVQSAKVSASPALLDDREAALGSSQQYQSVFTPEQKMVAVVDGLSQFGFAEKPLARLTSS